jgi:hypothetical protein
MSWLDLFRTKLNPAQASMQMHEGDTKTTTSKPSYLEAFNTLEPVNRGVSMIVNACSSLDYDIKDKVYEGIISGTRQKALNTLMNFRPNPYQSVLFCIIYQQLPLRF